MYKNNVLKKGLVCAILVLFVMGTLPMAGSLSMEEYSFRETSPSEYSMLGDSGLSLITIKVEGIIGENEWYVSDVTFTITYESDEIEAVFYRINGGEWIENIEPFVVSDDGQYVLEWYAVDYEGNQSEVDGPFDFKIDQTPPTVDLTWEASGGYVIFTATCSDATSGMDRVEFSINDILKYTDWTEPYEWIIEYYEGLEDDIIKATAYDKAGNSDYDQLYGSCIMAGLESSMFSTDIDKEGSHQSSQSIVPITEIVRREKHEVGAKLPFDCSRGGDTEPAYVIVVVNRKMGENDWVVSDVNISMIPDPDGIDAIYYKLDEEDWIVYTEPKVISNDGAHSFWWYVIDDEGYTSFPDSVFFKIDQTPPDIKLIKERIARNKVKFTADVYDETSNIERVEFRLGFTLQFTDYDFPYEWTWTGSGNHIVTAKVYDMAGNSASSSMSTPYVQSQSSSSSQSSKSVLPSTGSIVAEKYVSTDNQICKSNSRYDNDTTPPVTTISFDPPYPDGLNGWYVSNVTVTLNATDDMSGVNTTYYSINSEPWEVYDEPFLLHEDGLYYIVYLSVDNAGNMEFPKLSHLKLDQTSPDIEEVEWELYGIPFPDICKFTCIAVDETSGMNRVELYIYDALQGIITGPGPIYKFIMDTTAISFFTWTFNFFHYDFAGNSAFDSVKGSDIESYSNSQSRQQATTDSSSQSTVSLPLSTETEIVEKSSTPTSCDGNTLYVGGSGPNNYSSIQSAIDNASTDDTVFVYDDSSPYYEHVKINKRINLIGEDKNNTVIDGNFSGGAIVKINAGGVFISGFTIQNSGHHPPSLVGIGVSIASDGNHIIGNIIRNNWDGISLSHSNNIIEENSIIHNTYGVDIFDWDKCYFNNVITGNFIAHNGRSGICDDDRDVGTIATWNVIADNGKLDLHYSSQGVFKHDSYSVYHHNDFFFNSVNAVVNGGRYGNDWDDGSEGNFWDDWEDNTGYPNVYIIPSSLSEEIDHHPSVTPYSNSLVVGLSGHYYALIDEPIEFSADINVDPYSVSWYWEFGNGDTSNEVFPTYSYGSSGLYHINVTVNDNQGRSDTSKAEAHIGLAPNTPTITGPTCGKPGVLYNYTIVTIDPDGDDVYLDIWWGDMFDYYNLGPYPSGEEIIFSHSWHDKGHYTIMVRARDAAGLESDWGTLEVTMPVNYQISQQSSNPLFFQILGRLLNTR